MDPGVDQISLLPALGSQIVRPMKRYIWGAFSLGALALVIGPMHFRPPEVFKVPPLTAGKPAIDGTGAFAPDGVYTSTDRQDLPEGVQTRGSWLGSDAFQGIYLTDWYQARPEMTFALAGYPTLSGNRLDLEIRKKDGTSTTLTYRGDNPAESWQPWTVNLQSDAVGIRVRAVDGSSATRGWLAFSEPFTAARLSLGNFLPFLQIGLTTALAVTLLYGPGLLWFSSRPRAVSDLALAGFMGPVLLALTGTICWLLGAWISPATFARVAVTLILVTLVALSWRGRRRASPLSREIKTIVGIGLLLVGLCVAKANLSYAAPGELFHGTISRTLEIPGHSDSRIPYHVVQLVANHLAPFGPESVPFFSPWTFASRGPLAGLMAVPIVLAVGAEVPADLPHQRWRPFDRQGFAAYRIALIVLASLAGWSIFGVAAAIMDLNWAILAASTAFLAPFFVHEMYFTWPKLMAANGVISSFLLIKRSRPLAAGALLGIGYLFHPSAILAAPFLAFWILGENPSVPWKVRFLRGVGFAISLSAFVAAWLAVGSLRPKNSAGQDGFLSYFYLADNHLATWTTWWQSRFDTVTNTFIPFRLLFTDQTHESLNSIYGLSDGWVHFSFLYWNTLPFALGWPVFIVLGAAIIGACRYEPRIAFSSFLGPAIFLVIYWGCASTGLMRHCGQWLFLSSILLAVWSLRKFEGRWCIPAVLVLTSLPLLVLRVLDIGWMAFGTALHDHWPDLDAPFGVNDCFTLVIAVAFLAGIGVSLARVLMSVRKKVLSP